MRKLLEFICIELAAGRPVVCAVIVSATGSTPRTTGSRMAIAKDGRCCGTVGGGPAEAMAQKTGRNAHQTKASTLLRVDLTGKDAAADGMICGGRIDILVEYIPALDQYLQIFTRLLRGWAAGPATFLYTMFRQTSENTEVIQRTTDPEDLPEDLRAGLQPRGSGLRIPVFEKQNDICVLAEPMRSSGHVIIAGAGHVGRATANIAALAGFDVVVIDDRPEFLRPADFMPDCRIEKIDGFNHCFDGINTGHHSMIVIVTRGHVYDQSVLAQALNTRAGYVGMIGSRKKRDAIYANLMAQGVAGEILERVHSPIGLPIGADTPEEIAVSIVAELIGHRAGKN